jgi:(hydroxyamino)benzene mutase
MTTRTRALQGGLVDTKDRLVAAGVALFLLSLLTGFLLAAGPAFIVNPRGVLAGHIEGAMNGMFVILVGLFAPRVRLSDGAARLCMAALLYSAYANWFFTTLGGVLGTSEAMPIAGAGYHAGPALERVMTAGLVSVGVAMLVAVSLLLVGLRRKAGAALVVSV